MPDSSPHSVQNDFAIVREAISFDYLGPDANDMDGERWGQDPDALAALGRIEEQFDALHAAATELADFLWHEKETREPPTELLDQGYVALETSADYEREEALGEKLLIALGRDPNEVSTPAISHQNDTAGCVCGGCEKGDHNFDRSICACGVMHYYCNECGGQCEDCDPASSPENEA